MTTKTVIAIVGFVFSIILSFTALFLPPKGVIDNSVLILLAQMLLFVASLLGIDTTQLGFKGKR